MPNTSRQRRQKKTNFAPNKSASARHEEKLMVVVVAAVLEDKKRSAEDKTSKTKNFHICRKSAIIFYMDSQYSHPKNSFHFNKRLQATWQCIGEKDNNHHA